MNDKHLNYSPIDKNMNMVNGAFWVMFLISAAVSVWIALSDYFLLGLIFCFFVILAGLAKLEQDVINDELGETLDKMDEDIFGMKQNVEKSYTFAAESHDKSEKRFKKLDSKRSDSEKKTEKMHRDIIKKIIELENTLNKMKKDKK